MAPNPMPSLIIDTGGQEATVTVTAPNGRPLSAFTDPGGVTAASFPVTFDGTWQLWLAVNGTVNIVATVAGVTVIDQTVWLLNSVVTLTVPPVVFPEAYQWSTVWASENYEASPWDFVLGNAAGGIITVTLPAAPPVNDVVGVKKVDTSVNVVLVDPGPNTIDGATGLFTIRWPQVAREFIWDGTGWHHK